MSIIRVRDKNGNIIDIPAIKGNDYILTEVDKENIANKTVDLIQEAECIPLGSAENKLAQYAEGTLTELTAEDLKGATIISNNKFTYCPQLERVTLAEGITKVDDSAFANCHNLLEITIGDSIEYLSRYAFAGCKKIERVNIDSLAKWCNVTFTAVHNNLLRSGAVKVFIKNASGNYEEVTTTTTLVIPDTVTELKAFLFSYWAIEGVTIPESVTKIDKYVFYKCSNLKSIVIPNGVNYLQPSLFEDCTNLASISIPNSVTEIFESVFRNCASLTQIIIPDNVTYIAKQAFEGCSNITSLTVPSGIRSLSGINTFHIGSETNKATITFLRTTPPSISTALFKVEYLEKIIVPKGCGEAYKTATNWANFADYIEESAE